MQISRLNKLKNILTLIYKLNLFKSLYYSIKFRGHIYVGKAEFHIEGNGKIEFSSPNSYLLIGVYTTVPTPTVLTIMHNATLRVGQNSMINRGSKIVIHEGGRLIIGNNTYINENARIHCRKNIQIGNNCAIAWNTNIMDTDIHTIHYNDNKKNNDANIIIGNNVWIGANSTILKATTIEDNCIIGANSVAKGRMLSQNIYTGNPIESKGKFESWEV